MAKHTQIIHRQHPTDCLSVFDCFVELACKGLIFIRIMVKMEKMGFGYVNFQNAFC